MRRRTAVSRTADAEHEIKVRQLPDAKKIAFKTVEVYSDGKISRWIELPSGGEEPEQPAPVLELKAAAPGAKPVIPSPSASPTPSPTPSATEPTAEARGLRDRRQSRRGGREQFDGPGHRRGRSGAAHRGRRHVVAGEAAHRLVAELTLSSVSVGRNRFRPTDTPDRKISRMRQLRRRSSDIGAPST
ncbi:YcnI family protein [Streptomyces phaeochromogenes]|uniref:DUF1775 domain-containing protein n=1 Tax=Streptomyces phaeochromogenes TaxID=1923 RepID=UPI00225B984D|nr:DUF1775 domain-containing protein [Streptomyces phaeochromogenes]MCX5601253.1 YcnI family protein [Streptomyces phaeochromogenes]